MKLDLNFQFEGIELLGFSKEAAAESEDAMHVGRVLSTVLAKSTESDNCIKFFDWALDLYKKKPIEIDKQDAEILKKFVKNHAQLFTIVKAQIINKIDALSKV